MLPTMQLGKIIKTYAYGEVCPTEFFDGIAIKKMVDTAHNNGHYVITDYDGNVITSKYVSSADRFFKIYNLNDEIINHLLFLTIQPRQVRDKLCLKQKMEKIIILFGTEN